MYFANEQVHCQADVTGILVGGANPFPVSGMIQQAIANEHSVPIANVEEDGICCRSAWFPTHGYDGLLFREKEDAIVIAQDGEVTVKLFNFFCAFVVNKWQHFFRAKKFDEQGLSDNGMKVVSETDIDIVLPLQNVSRKVMLVPHADEAARGPIYVVNDFMRRIFPISAGTVVVHYYPVRNDMIEVRGDVEGTCPCLQYEAENCDCSIFCKT